MASVEKRTDRPGYLVRWRDSDGRQRKRSFRRKLDADRYRAELEHSQHTGSYVDPRAGKATFREYAEAWRLAQPHRHNTVVRTRSQLEKHIYPVLGSRPLASVRPSDVQALVATLATTLKPNTVRTVFSCVRSVFAAAVADRAIGHDPAARVTLPRMQRREVQPPTVEQVEALAAAMPDRYRALVVVAAGTGMRPGEVYGLQVRDVDFLRRTIRVERQVQPVAGQPVVSPLKTPSSYRTIPVGQVVVDALAAHLAGFPASADGFVFTDGQARPLLRVRFGGGVWRPAARAAGLVGLGQHALRHFYASALIRAGLSVKVVSARLGHTSAAMTLDVYGHLWADDEDRSRAAIDDLLGAPWQADVPRLRPAGGA